MNWLDIVIALLLAYAAWEGWRQGLVTQALGLVAIAMGVFLAWRMGHSIGTALGMEGTAATVGGFVLVLVVVIVGVVLIGRLTRGLFRIVGLGVWDNVLGVLFSALKAFVLVGLVMMVFEAADPDGKVITHAVRQGSFMYRAVDAVNGVVFPFVKDIFRL